MELGFHKVKTGGSEIDDRLLARLHSEYEDALARMEEDDIDDLRKAVTQISFSKDMIMKSLGIEDEGLIDWRIAEEKMKVPSCNNQMPKIGDQVFSAGSNAGIGSEYAESTDTPLIHSLSSSRTGSIDCSRPSSPSTANESALVGDSAAKDTDVILRRSWRQRVQMISQLAHLAPSHGLENISIQHTDRLQEPEPDSPPLGATRPLGLLSPDILGLDGLLSVGSAFHSHGKCQPCAWYWKPQGCQHGYDCKRCHHCPEGEIKSRKRSKKELLRAMEKSFAVE